MTIFVDIETYSETPIKYGTAKYAESAELLLFAWSVDDASPKLWDATRDAMPAELHALLTGDDILVAHNAAFEQAVLDHVLPFQIDPKRWRCSMAKAYAHSLPGSLDTLSEILELPQDQAKQKAGRQLVRLFCIPPAKNLKRARATRHTHPKEWEEFCQYCAQDVTAMVQVWNRIPSWNYRGAELDLWHLDQAINRHGVLMDTELARASIRAVGLAQKNLAARTVELTGGAVQAATQRDKLLAHLLAEYGVDLPDLTKSTLERRIEDQSLPWALRELLLVRLQASTASTAKYQTILNYTSSDSRLRYSLQFCGAGRTGRWAGRGPQFQNMPRPTLRQSDIDFGIEALKADCEDLLFDNVMLLTSSAIRGCIRASEGKKLVVADLSNIEGRGLAWLGREKWKLKAFADYDAGIGHDLYKLSYGRSFNVDPANVTKDQRQVGKVQELALGYEGGVGAFLTFALAYNLDLEDMAAQGAAGIPKDIWEEARGMLEWTKKRRRSTFGLSDQAFMVCDSFKRGWRRGHPNVVALWAAVADAVRQAIMHPGVTYEANMLKIRRDKTWLRVRLPSGRYLCYPSPEVAEDGQISYMGVNQYSRKWSRIKTYGGKLVENITQAFARDIMAANMPAAEAAGYEIVLTVHDEIICEAPDDPAFNHEHLASILATVPAWAPGLPLAAAGFEDYRYKKD